MKEQTQNGAIARPAAGSANHGPENQNTEKDADKIFLQKKRERTRNLSEADVEREEQEREALLKREGLVDKGKKELAREAAFDDLQDYELCQDLAGRHARESAKKTEIGDVRDRYQAIALGFRCARGAQFSKAPLALGSALNALAEEFERDRKGLLRFLDAVFKRWREIDRPDSLWRVRLVTHQHGGRDRERIADHLEKIGAVPKNTTEKLSRSLRLRIGQYLSRDQRSALPKKILTELRAAKKHGRTESEIFQRYYFSSAAVPNALDTLRRSGQANWKWKRTKTTDGKVIRAKLWFAVKKSSDRND